ncbi:MAG: gamma carbonic anhydrase family protein [Clostridia bacterium]|nr:gamma carbonic anhydrase family protein [Clostridia bacterium]
MKLSYNGIQPEVASDVYVAPSATLVGDVRVGARCSIWFGACLRGDLARITLREGTNIQDNASVHCDQGIPVEIGRNVTVGHNAVIHSCTIGDNVVIGMGAILLTGSSVGEGSVVAAGAVVRQGTVIPPHTMAAGIPATVKRVLTDVDSGRNQANAEAYARLAAEYILSADQ